MKVSVYQCDVCHANKLKANHWFLVTHSSRNFMLEPWEGATEEAIEQATMHLCGEACVQKAVNEFMGRVIQKAA